MDRTLEVVVLPVSDIDASVRYPDGNSWAVQQLKVRGEKPLIPLEHRDRFGA